MIELENVWKEYFMDGKLVFSAVKDVSFRIDRGEFTALLGPSGSGKSTIMHLIGLLDKPTRGKILINGDDIEGHNDDTISTLRNEFVGFVFQQFNLINKLTVVENILLPTLYYQGTKTEDFRSRAQDLMERFGIAEKAHSYPNRISGGQQQRVAIARALIMNPQLILADEPTGNLDTKTGEEIMNLLVELNKKDKITVVIVTHEADIAAKARREIKIIDGKIKN